MYCTNCGNEINDKAVVCIHCGAAVDKEYFGNDNTENKTACSAQPAYNNRPNQKFQPVYQAEPAEQPKKENTIAIVGFIFAFLMPIVGIICSAIGYKRAKNENGEHKELALAGLIISIVETVIAVLAVLIYLFIVLFVVGVFGSIAGAVAGSGYEALLLLMI